MSCQSNHLPWQLQRATKDDCVRRNADLLDDPDTFEPWSSVKLSKRIPHLTTRNWELRTYPVARKLLQCLSLWFVTKLVRPVRKRLTAEEVSYAFQCYLLNKTEGVEGVLVLRTKPDNHFVCTFIDLSHVLDLLVSFQSIMLIDTYCIDPDPFRFRFGSQPLQSQVQVRCH